MCEAEADSQAAIGAIGRDRARWPHLVLLERCLSGDIRSGVQNLLVASGCVVCDPSPLQGLGKASWQWGLITVSQPP